MAKTKRKRTPKNTTLQNPAKWFLDWVRDDDTEGNGVVVNGKTALQYPPIWYAVSKIGGHIGQLPCVLYQRKGERGKERAAKHPAYRLIKTRPNEAMTASVFRETIQAHSLLWGNGRAAIERNGRNDPVSLIPLLPDRTITVLVNGQKWHCVTDSATGEITKIPDRDVIHIPGLSFDGLTGYSVIEMAKNSIGLGLNAERQANNLYRNNAVPPMVLEAPPGVFKEEQKAKQFLDDWNEYHQGVNKSNRVGLLREGIKATTLSTSAKEADSISQRNFQRVDAALWMLLEQILGDDSSVSYNSLEQKNQAYLTNCLLRWLVKWEQELSYKLLTDAQHRSEDYFFKFITAALLRGTTKERYEVYSLGRQMEVLSANDVREMEDMDPIPGGDEYSNPAINPQTTGAAPPSDPKKTPPPPPDKGTAAALDTLIRIGGTSIREYSLKAHIERLVESRVMELLAVERREVQEHLAAKNFMDWLDKFYGSSDFSRLVPRVVQELGGTKEQADEWLASSKQRLSTVAGANKPATFGDGLRAEIEQWNVRADKLADDILTNCSPYSYDSRQPIEFRPVINVNVPEQPSQPAPIINVSPQVIVPQQPAPVINLPQQPAAQVTVNLPEPPPPIVNVTTPVSVSPSPAPNVTVNVPPPAEYDIEPVRDSKTGLTKRFKRVPKDNK